MRELTSTHVDSVVGGNLVTGWVPPYWPGITLLPGIRVSPKLIGVSIPGLSAVGNSTGQLPATGLVIGPFVPWQC